MKHFHFPTIAKALLMTVVLGSPALLSAQIFPIGTVQNNSNIVAFPNPFTSDLSVQNVPAVTPEILIELYTLQGAVVLQERVAHQPLLTVSTTALIPGTYELIVKDENYNVLFTKKVVKAPRSLRQ